MASHKLLKSTEQIRGFTRCGGLVAPKHVDGGEVRFHCAALKGASTGPVLMRLNGLADATKDSEKHMSGEILKGHDNDSISS